MDRKRRLPLVDDRPRPAPRGQDAEADEEAAARDPWQWIGFGTAATFAAWLPLAYLAEALKARVFAPYLGGASSPDAIAAALALLPDATRTRLSVLAVLFAGLPLVLGAAAGGYLVGRWGGRAGVREAALSGLATALVASALACAASGLSWAPLVAIVVAVPSSALGARVGLRARGPR